MKRQFSFRIIISVLLGIVGVSLLRDAQQPVAVLFSLVLLALSIVSCLSFVERSIRLSKALIPLLVLVVFVGIWAWILMYQPSAGQQITTEEVYFLLAVFWWLLNFVRLSLAPERRPLVAKSMRGVAGGLMITFMTIGLLVTGAELGMRYLLVQSDNFAFSKMHQNWVNLHWQPINALGYRDYPVNDRADDLILVLGDSLVTGYGVEDIDDTFPHVLADQFEGDVAVNIVAQPGWGIATALWAAQQYPETPDVVILSHYINDILEGPAGKLYARPFPQLRLEPEAPLAWWVDNLYLANFAYYRFYHYVSEHDAGGQYVDHTLSAYMDATVWTAYQDELADVIEWAESINAQLYVIVWPNLTDVVGSIDVTAQIVDFFVARGVPVVDLTEDFLDEPVMQLVVNAFDGHPNVASHAVAAGRLYDLITAER